MRVITGTARGKRLGELKGNDTRPTTGKVKEGLFSALQFEIEGRRVLDLFAGTGQLGIEALSRGAQWCTFVDCRRDAADLVRRNLEICELSDRAEVLCGDAMGFLNGRCKPYGLIFLDPPYAGNGLDKAITAIVRFDILAPGGILVAEAPADKPLPDVPAFWHMRRSYRYGKIKVTVLERDRSEKEENS